MTLCKRCKSKIGKEMKWLSKEDFEKPNVKVIVRNLEKSSYVLDPLGLYKQKASIDLATGAKESDYE